MDCRDCDERKRNQRNCHNRKGYKETILQGRDEWLTVSSRAPHALKLGDVKFMACPVSTITRKTWDVLALVNDCITAEHGDLINLPYPGTILDQPEWFREAVKIVRNERNEHRKAQMEKRKRA